MTRRCVTQALNFLWPHFVIVLLVAVTTLTEARGVARKSLTGR